MGGARQAIIDGSFPAYLTAFMKEAFGDESYPGWVVDALDSVGIKLGKN